MKKTKSVDEYLKPKTKTLIQVRIEAELVEQVNSLIRKRHIKMGTFVAALFRKFLDEYKNKTD